MTGRPRDSAASRLLLVPLAVIALALESRLGAFAAVVSFAPDLLVALLAAWGARRGTMVVAVVFGVLRAVLAGTSRGAWLLGFLLAGALVARLRPAARQVGAVDRALVAAGAFALAYLPLVFVTVRAGHPIAELLWGGLLAAGATGALTALFAVPLELVERRGSKAPLP